MFIIDYFEEKLKSLLASGSDKTVIKKSTLIEKVDLAKSSLVAFKNNFATLSPDHLAKFTLAVKDETGPFCGTYKKFLAGLQNKARTAEQKVAYTALLDVSGTLIDTLDKLAKRIGELFEENTNLHNARFSHLVVLGTMDICEQYGKFCTYLMNGMVQEIVKQTPPPPKYRQVYVEEALQICINVTNRIYNFGAIDFDNSIRELQRANNDILVLDDNAKPNTTFVTPKNFSETTGMLTQRAFENPAFVIGKIWALYSHIKVTRAQQEREWMEAQVSLLKLSLEGKDPDSPEYLRVIKVIEKYEEMMTKLDRDIDKYYNGK